MLIGIPRESEPGGSLVAPTAKTVVQLTDLGHDLIVESGAGDQPDSAFTEGSRGNTVVRDGESTWPPPTVQVSAVPAGHPTAPVAEAAVEEEMKPLSPGARALVLAGIAHATELLAGAVNPAESRDASSPIAGMPDLEAWNTEDIIVFKWSMAAGHAGVQNPLFFRGNSQMLFGDAKDRVEDIICHLKVAAHA
ncbi:NAD(P)(+) transhydrogenase (Re/Si-specific) subunit beta [Streptomyces sp. NPDC056982]|uniref:NAD(P)(+) transhydrogenase (Re/Si-specific) subunit beta n=1 Tax=Streptomyces sp. NPDC056982 TaxID=3345986 RepID=UPI0036459D1F